MDYLTSCVFCVFLNFFYYCVLTCLPVGTGRVVSVQLLIK